MSRLLTMQEAADELRICTSTLREHVLHGEIPFVSIGRGEKRKRRLFDPADLQAFIEARKEREVCTPVRFDKHPTFNMTPRAKVYSFTDLIAAERAKKEQKKAAKGKPRRRRGA